MFKFIINMLRNRIRLRIAQEQPLISTDVVGNFMELKAKGDLMAKTYKHIRTQYPGVFYRKSQRSGKVFYIYYRQLSEHG